CSGLGQPQPNWKPNPSRGNGQIKPRPVPHDVGCRSGQAAAPCRRWMNDSAATTSRRRKRRAVVQNEPTRPITVGAARQSASGEGTTAQLDEAVRELPALKDAPGRSARCGKGDRRVDESGFGALVVGAP